MTPVRNGRWRVIERRAFEQAGWIVVGAPPSGGGESKGDKASASQIGHSSVRFLDPFPPGARVAVALSTICSPCRPQLWTTSPGADRPGQTRGWLGPHGAGIAITQPRRHAYSQDKDPDAADDAERRSPA